MTNQNAKRDDSYVPTILAVSNADGVSTVQLWGDPITHRLLVQNPISSGSGAPNSTPSFIGQDYIDTTGKKVYKATGTSSSSDWTILN